MTVKFLKKDTKVEVGKETTWGTAVAPTAKILGVNNCTITPLVDVERITDLRGDWRPSHSTFLRSVGGEATLEGVLTYEQAGYLFEALFYISDTDAYVASDNPTVHTFYPPVYASDVRSPRIQTLVHGSGSTDAPVYALNGATLRTLELNGEIDGSLTYTANFIGASVSTDTLAGATDPSISYVRGHNLSSLYIDPGTDAIGTTPVSDTMFSFRLSLTNNRSILRHMGDFEPQGYKDESWDGTLELVLEMNSVSEPYLDSIVSATDKGVEKNVRMIFTSGTDSITIDFCGSIQDAPDVYTDLDGVLTNEFTLTAQKTDGASDWCKVVWDGGITACT